jgi:hypothetical protein
MTTPALENKSPQAGVATARSRGAAPPRQVPGLSRTQGRSFRSCAKPRMPQRTGLAGIRTALLVLAVACPRGAAARDAAAGRNSRGGTSPAISPLRLQDLPDVCGGLCEPDGEYCTFPDCCCSQAGCRNIGDPISGMIYPICLVASVATPIPAPSPPVPFPDYCVACVSDDGACSMPECCCSGAGCYSYTPDGQFYYSLCRPAASRAPSPARPPAPFPDYCLPRCVVDDAPCTFPECCCSDGGCYAGSQQEGSLCRAAGGPAPTATPRPASTLPPSPAAQAPTAAPTFPCPAEADAWAACLATAGVDSESEVRACLGCRDDYRGSLTDATTCVDLTQLICSFGNAPACAEAVTRRSSTSRPAAGAERRVAASRGARARLRAPPRLSRLSRRP